MARFRFEGQVFPIGLNITTRKHPCVQVEDDHIGTMRFDVTIDKGHIVVDSEIVNDDVKSSLPWLLIRAFDLANASVNLTAFSMGVGAKVVFDSLIDENGNKSTLVLRDRDLERLCTAFSPNDDSFDKILEFVIQDPRLSEALQNLVESISKGHAIPLNCARAIETLRAIILPQNLDRKLGWSMMRDQLRLTEAYLKSITDFGVAPRHGDHVFVSGEDNRKIAERSWIIMNRFLEYKKRGNKALPLLEFPLLDI